MNDRIAEYDDDHDPLNGRYDEDLMDSDEQDAGECETERPCGNKECMRFVEECGGDPESPSDWICSACGGEGPMRRYFDQYPDVDDDN